MIIGSKFKNLAKKIVLLFKGAYIENNDYLYNFPFISKSKLFYYVLDNSYTAYNLDNANNTGYVNNNANNAGYVNNAFNNNTNNNAGYVINNINNFNMTNNNSQKPVSKIRSSVKMKNMNK